MSQVRTVAHGEVLTLGLVLRVLRRRWPSILLLLALSLSAAVAITLTRTPVFRATSTIEMGEQAMGGGLLSQVMAVPMLPTGTTADGDLAFLESRRIASETVAPPVDGGLPTPRNPDTSRHLGLRTLVQNENLTPLSILVRQFLDPSDPDRAAALPDCRLFASTRREADDAPRKIRLRFLSETRLEVSTAGLLVALGLKNPESEERDYQPGESFAYRGLEITLGSEGPLGGKSFVVKHLPEHEAVEKLMARSWARETVPGSGIIEVTVEDTSPHRARETADALCNNFLHDLAVRNGKSSDIVLDHIRGLIDEQMADFDAAQDEIVALQLEQPLMINMEATATSVIEQIAGLEFQRIRIGLSTFLMEDMLRALEEGDASVLAGIDRGGPLGIASSLGITVDPISEGYLQEIAQLGGEYSLLVQEFTTEALPAQQILDAIEELEGRIRDQLAGRIESLKAQMKVIEGEVNTQRDQLGSFPNDLRAIAALRIRIEAHTEILPVLVQSYHQAQISQISAQTAPDFVDRAPLPSEPHSPSLQLNLAVGLTIGLLLGLVLGLVREVRLGPVIGTDQLAEIVGSESAAPLPNLRRELGRTAVQSGLPIVWDEHAGGESANAFRRLRARVVLELPADQGGRTVGVTASRTGDGSSTTTLNLAVALARSGNRVLLVDADLRRDDLSRRFAGAEASEGEGVLRVEALDLDLLPAARTQRSAGGRISSIPWARRLEELQSDYDYVVLDLPSVLEAPETLDIAGSLDGTLLVCRAGTPTPAVLESARMLRSARAHLLDAVLIG